MNYDDNIETLDKLFNAINEAMQEKVEMGITVTSDPYNYYIIHKKCKKSSFVVLWSCTLKSVQRRWVKGDERVS